MRVAETLPVARQTYIVQVRLGPQSIVIGVVQPEADRAVKVRRRPRTTLYFKPDMTTPSVGEILRPRVGMLRVVVSDEYGNE